MDSQRTPLKVLIADDYFAFAHILAVGLEVYSDHLLRCEVAPDGADALARLRAAHYDILLADLSMMPMNGFQLIHEVRLDVNLRQLPIIVVSGYLDTTGVRTAIQEGVQAMLVKPVSIRQVWQAIIGVLGIKLPGDRSEGDSEGDSRIDALVN